MFSAASDSGPLQFLFDQVPLQKNHGSVIEGSMTILPEDSGDKEVPGDHRKQWPSLHAVRGKEKLMCIHREVVTVLLKL